MRPLLIVLAAALTVAQTPPGIPATAPATPLTAEQLDNLVAPIALYPDPLLSEIFAASTYPIEIAEAQQWVRDHPKWKPSKLMDEAKKEQWDASVQGLVAFPEVLTRLSQDIGWTTQLGNAFLAQQADVMQAVQRMRASAQAKGTLQTTPQEVVNTQNQNGQSAITIEPANPDIWYVPNYNPVYIWGPPVWGYYPSIFYPGVDVGFSFFPGIDIGLYYGGWGGWGWGGWGWGPDWFGGVIFINHSFFHRYGFEHFHGEPLGRSAWEHNPEHRLGVPYANRSVAARYGSSPESRGLRTAEPGNREFRNAPQQRFGTGNFEQRGYTNNHSVFGGYHSGTATRAQSDHGFSSIGGARSGGFGGGGGFHGGGGGAHVGGGRR